MSSWVSNLLLRRIVWWKCNSVTGSCCCGVFFQVKVQLMNYIAPNSPKCYPTKKISHPTLEHLHPFFIYRHESATWKLEVDWRYWSSNINKAHNWSHRSLRCGLRSPKLLPLQRSDRGPFPWRTLRKRAAQQLRWGNPAPSPHGAFSSWSAIRIYPSVWKTKVTIEALSAITQRLQSQKPNQQLTLFLVKGFDVWFPAFQVQFFGWLIWTLPKKFPTELDFVGFQSHPKRIGLDRGCIPDSYLDVPLEVRING